MDRSCECIEYAVTNWNVPCYENVFERTACYECYVKEIIPILRLRCKWHKSVKLNFTQITCVCGLNPFGQRQGWVTCLCRNGDEPLCPTNGGIFYTA